MTTKVTTKESLINALLSSQGWISGEQLSQSLGVSRMAIAKQISTLRREGYLIESAPRKGYHLQIAPDCLDIAALRSALKVRYLGTQGWHLIESTTSTNQEAMLLAVKGAPEGEMVIAKTQTEGKGRKGKSWFSAPRSAHFSFILRPDCTQQAAQAWLTKIMDMAMLSVQDTLQQFGIAEVEIRYPNDLFVQGKKIAGILVEVGYIAEEIDWVVIGIGCNLNSHRSEFPEGIKAIITSTFEETGRYFLRNDFYQAVIEAFDAQYRVLKELR